MTETLIRLTGPNAKGPVVDASMLRDLLDALVDAVQQAVRLRTDGRSRAPGFAPAWLTKAAAFLVEFREGSTQIALLASPLGEPRRDHFAPRRWRAIRIAHSSACS